VDKAIADVFTANHGLVGVFTPDFGLTSGVARAIQNAGKSQDIKMVGTWHTGADVWSNFGDLKDVPELQGTDFVIQDSYALGYQAVNTVLKTSREPNTQQTAYIEAATVVPGINFRGQLKDWGLAAGPGLSDDDQILHILYATNRVLLDEDKQNFNGELDKETHYGIAYVRVPENHLFGHLETSNWDNADSEINVFMLKKRQGMVSDRFKFSITASTVKSVVIFVPGFRNTFDDGLFRFAQIIWDGQIRDMIPILFSWPSRGDVKDYVYDGESALNSVDAFEKLLLLLQNDCKIDNINIVAYSMGNRVVLAALAELSKHHEIKPLGELVLAAADVNKNEFTQNAALIEEAARGVTLYASSSDRALDLSEGIAQMPRVGKVESGGPITIEGVDSIDVTAIRV
jgi:esterase/lipase superfamily enzyme